MTHGVKRFMMYVTEDNYEELKKVASNRNLSSVQMLIRELISEHLKIVSKIKIFETDVMCPQCGSDGEIVEDYEENRYCLNCGNREGIGVN